MASNAGAIEQNGIPVPEEGTPEYEKMNKMARRAIPLTLIIFTLGILEQQAFGMIFVNIGKQLGTPGLAPLITSIPGIVLGIVCVVYGSLGDFVSLKKMTLLGTWIFVAGSVIGFAFGPINIWAVVIARVLQSAGGQVAGSVFLVLVSKYVSKAARVVYYQIFVAVFRFSAAIGVVLAGYVEAIDWRWLFAAAILAVVFIPALAKNLPDQHAKGARIDGIGFTLIGLFAGAVTMFFTDMNWLWAISSIVTLIAFIIYINKAKHPFITPNFFKNPAFILTMIVIFVGYFFSYTLNAGINAIGLNVFHISSAEVSNLLVWSILVAAVLGFCGPLIKKMGRTVSIILALSFMGLGLIAIAFAIPYGKVAALAIAPCIYYFGTSFFYSPIVDTATLTVSAQESGRVLGLNDLIQAITGSIGVALFGNMMASGAMSGGSIAGVKGGQAATYANVFLVGGVIVLAALAVYVIFHKVIYSRAPKGTK
ncbi:MFS transporter [Lacticaseibacillus rhamnosus]|uniref:MFS transporter n=1 Tax=Lacticaseibacillus rhamnosus TaxID=47715 RepID=UPI0008A1DFCA|nr:MFS transporter [Lacticaseibacillus rhamnosus]OFN10332.1 MFS transporter [Lactobacillus sp. HMSC072E07]MDE3295495.1 MFS transporter [Lacticaseibacillus rhamnosus]MDK7182404.1 MFS transporter [Lacticaseibacillus rhamnosus]MDK7240405.1 MFS transporter [Lacticaseibacillus rhamnosus]MDT8863575.1 MFS transporter [Lacticaseibacillus rhamnosus]